ncbi:hypothetical protein HZS_6776 [Henneguya salminicola]|nr:hypothetical protein HZS_6776 [Henneguya salminicola]
MLSSKTMIKYSGKIPLEIFNTVKDIFIYNKIEDNNYIVSVLKSWHDFVDSKLNIKQGSTIFGHNPALQDNKNSNEQEEFDTSLKTIFTSMASMECNGIVLL